MKKIFTDKKIIITMLSILLVLSIMMSTTYALFFRVDTLDTPEVYTSGVLQISVDKGSVLTLSDTLPISDEDAQNLTPYTFTIKNTGDLAYTFDLKMMATTSSNPINYNYVKVQIDDDTPVTFGTLIEGLIKEEITLNPGKDITMSVRIWLDENTPNTEIGKNFSAKITTDGIGTESASYQTLSKLGLTSLVKTGTPDFNTVATTDEGIYTAEDDLGTSYYFRGASENNYVYFAERYWRIVRINGNGTIRMIYDGTTKHENGELSADRQLQTTAYNAESTGVHTDNAGVGYMYGAAGQSTYEATHANTNSSTIKGVLDTWYRDNIDNTEYEQYVADAIYCNDRQVATIETMGMTGNGIGTSMTGYGIYNRMEINFESMEANISPTLKCTQPNDRFTQSTSIGNGALAATYPIGLITIDEANMAGGAFEIGNESYYLYNGQDYWTMSPLSFSGDSASMWHVPSSGTLGVGKYVADPSSGARPIVALKSNVTFGGNGSYETPFYIE